MPDQDSRLADTPAFALRSLRRFRELKIRCPSVSSFAFDVREQKLRDNVAVLRVALLYLRRKSREMRIEESDWRVFVPGKQNIAASEQS